MGNITENKIWIDGETCLTMAESAESFVDIYDKNMYDRKESDNVIKISGLGCVHLPSIETYPLYFKGIDSDPHVLPSYYICTKEEYINAIYMKIDECKKELNYYEELLDIVKGDKK